MTTSSSGATSQSRRLKMAFRMRCRSSRRSASRTAPPAKWSAKTPCACWAATDGGGEMKIGLLTLTQRPTRGPGDAWEEDLREIIEADRLGVSEAWITEHFGPFRSNMLPLADLFICKAAALTKQIRLGP